MTPGEITFGALLFAAIDHALGLGVEKGIMALVKARRRHIAFNRALSAARGRTLHEAADSQAAEKVQG